MVTPGKLFWSWAFVGIAYTAILAFAIMLAEGQFLASKILFCSANVLLAVKIITVLEGEHRQGVFSVVFAVTVLISGGLIWWVDLKQMEYKNAFLTSIYPYTPTYPPTGFDGSGHLIPDNKPTNSNPKFTVPPPQGHKVSNHPPPSKPAKTKPQDIAATYPIVLVYETKVTYDKDTGKIAVILTVVNTTQTEVNVHIAMHGVGFENGVEMGGNLNETTRDIGLGPPPTQTQMTGNYTVNSATKAAFEDGTSYVMIYLEITYPDRGGTTTYHYQAKTLPNSATLDEISSGWDGPK